MTRSNLTHRPVRVEHLFTPAGEALGPARGQKSGSGTTTPDSVPPGLCHQPSGHPPITHPCPAIWNAEFLNAFTDSVAGIGSYFEATGGTLPDSDALFLAERMTRLDWMPEEVRGLMSDLEMLREARRSPNPGQPLSSDEA